MRAGDPTRFPSRRRFLRIAGASIVPATLAACRGSGPDERRGDAIDTASGEGFDRRGSGPRGDRGTDPVGAGGDEETPPSLDRPILREWADDMVWVASPIGQLPVAYVSMADRMVFVDRAFRDRAIWLLDAHVSVSTQHWRIRLPGDPPAQPISPGDESREFEERDIRAWNPSAPPAMDDLRILRGRAAPRRIEFGCMPVAGSDAGGWCRGGPFDVAAVAPDHEATTRERFGVIGTGLRYPDLACERVGRAVQYLTWSASSVTAPG